MMKTGMTKHVICVMAALMILCASACTGSCGDGTNVNQTATTSTAIVFPDFIPAIRAYGGAGFDEFQISTLGELGYVYVQGVADFEWQNIEPREGQWKWNATDAQMDALAAAGLKTIAFVICPKLLGLHWNESIARNDPRFISAYEELAYQIVNRYHNHPAWSGMVTVWGGSSDIWDREVSATDPEIAVPLMNAAYDGIKRADPATIVVGFNFATTAHPAGEWELYHERAFALSPKFDWYGAQSHGVFATALSGGNPYAGLQGLVNVRRFLNEHGYADKPVWLNEGGFLYGEDVGGLSARAHAEEAVQTYIVARTLDANLKGWVYFNYFQRSHDSEDYGIMSTLDESNPPAPREAWDALKTLIRDAGFFDYRFERKLSGEVNQASPYVLVFQGAVRPASKLWIVFSPRLAGVEPLTQSVQINVAPFTQVRLIGMLGNESTLTADAGGYVYVDSTSSPLYLKAGD